MPPSQSQLTYVHEIKTNAKWLNTNGELPLCLAQPKKVLPELLRSDSPRLDSIALAKAIFKTESGVSALQRWFNNENGLLLFPEYAFGSGDFAEVNELVESYRNSLVVLAGFGAVKGSVLRRKLPVDRDSHKENFLAE